MVMNCSTNDVSTHWLTFIASRAGYTRDQKMDQSCLSEPPLATQWISLVDNTMPRPGQQAYRRKKQQDRDRESAADAVDSAPALLRPGNDDDEDEADDDEQQPKTVAGQALPVAVLPEDFDGDASDGATYLALAK